MYMMDLGLYSKKNIVSSSRRIREDEADVVRMADELHKEIMDFHQKSQNDVVYNSLKDRSK